MWQTLPFHDDLDNVHGRVDPLELATRLRELRAAAALEVVEELGRMQPGIDEFQGTVAIHAEQSSGELIWGTGGGCTWAAYINPFTHQSATFGRSTASTTSTTDTAKPSLFSGAIAPNFRAGRPEGSYIQ